MIGGATLGNRFDSESHRSAGAVCHLETRRYARVCHWRHSTALFIASVPSSATSSARGLLRWWSGRRVKLTLRPRRGEMVVAEVVVRGRPQTLRHSEQHVSPKLEQ